MKTFQEYMEAVSDNVISDDDFRSVVSHFETVAEPLLTKLRLEKEERQNGRDIAFHKKHCEHSFNITNSNSYIGFLFHFKVEVSSHSLADPRANYQTTSARIVKHKSYKLSTGCTSKEQAIKVIDRYVEKLKKDKVI